LNTKAIVDKAGRFYKAQDRFIGTHLALRWNGRLRFIVPREAAALKVCFNTFHPGWKELPLRAMAHLQRIMGAKSCVEDTRLKSIRDVIGIDAGLSCCRAGTPGPWSKDSILFLDKKAVMPFCIVKAGTGEAVDVLLQNEANWLRSLRDQASLAGHIPELVAHRSGADFTFVAQSVLKGKVEYRLEEMHFTFLRKFQEYSRRTVRFEESILYKNLRTRLTNMRGLLSKAWSTRIEIGVQRIEQSLSGAPILFAAAHNDFAPWNIRAQHGVACIYDWEYADHEQLPLFDPLHFSLMPLALKRKPLVTILSKMRQSLLLCQQHLGKESCYKAQTQVFAYLINLCTLYLWIDREKSVPQPVLESYAQIIDYMMTHEL
jgi:hypothetical protein